VLLHTGWSERYGTPSYFANPFLDEDACRRMLERGVRTICIDAINLDETPDDEHPGEGFPVHHLIARAGGVIGENFRNLGQVDWAAPFVMCLPIALAGADGAPVRAVAVELQP
jgi:kynurenine formamidase